MMIFIFFISVVCDNFHFFISNVIGLGLSPHPFFVFCSMISLANDVSVSFIFSRNQLLVLLILAIVSFSFSFISALIFMFFFSLLLTLEFFFP